MIETNSEKTIKDRSIDLNKQSYYTILKYAGRIFYSSYRHMIYRTHAVVRARSRRILRVSTTVTVMTVTCERYAAPPSRGEIMIFKRVLPVNRMSREDSRDVIYHTAYNRA